MAEAKGAPMSHPSHDPTDSELRHTRAADADGVITDPPGRSPAEVDDSALRRIDGRHENDQEERED